MEALKVLIVDDSATMQDELTQLYKSLGHQVIATAGNGLEALEKVKELSPDLVSLDIIMPDMDGIETYRKLRLLDFKPRVLIVSALANEPRLIQAYQHEISVDHYCAKPVISEFLAEKIRLIMGQEPMPLPETKLDDETSVKELSAAE